MPDGLPSTALVRGAMIALGVGVVLGLYLLFATPTLPNERERTGAAPAVTATVTGGPRSVGGGTATPIATQSAAAGTPTATPQPERRHTIRAGDTLLAIAQQYDTTVDALRAANPGLTETALQVGREIVIPAGR